MESELDSQVFWEDVAMMERAIATALSRVFGEDIEEEDQEDERSI